VLGCFSLCHKGQIMSDDLQSERVTVTLFPSEVAEIDKFQDELSVGSREEAVHALIDLGLKAVHSRGRPI